MYHLLWIFVLIAGLRLSFEVRWPRFKFSREFHFRKIIRNAIWFQSIRHTFSTQHLTHHTMWRGWLNLRPISTTMKTRRSNWRLSPNAISRWSNRRRLQTWIFWCFPNCRSTRWKRRQRFRIRMILWPHAITATIRLSYKISHVLRKHIENMLW